MSNIDFNDLRPFEPGERRDNGDGTFSTELSRGVQIGDEVANVPSLWKRSSGETVDLKDLSDDELGNVASGFETRSGNRFKRFNSFEEATAAATERSAAGGAGSGAPRYEAAEPEAAALAEGFFRDDGPETPALAATPPPVVEEAPGDAPGDDHTDLFLRDRYEGIEGDQSLDWLAEFTGRKPQAAAPADDGFIGGAWRAATGVARDVATGAPETPRQIVGGARDAVDNTLGALDDIGVWVRSTARSIGVPGVRDGDPDSLQEIFNKIVPEVKAPRSATGGVVRSVTQFVVGFIPALKAVKVLRAGVAVAKVGRAAQAATAGGIASGLVFDPHADRLSNLIEQVPQLRNPVTEYLKATPDDTAAEGRLKNFAEGLGLGVLAEGFVLGVRAIRSARAAKAATPEAQARRQARIARLASRTGEAPPTGSGELRLLGSSDAPLTVPAASLRATVKAEPAAVPGAVGAEAKLAAAAQDVDAAVLPDQVAARALTEGLEPLGKGDVYVNFARINAPEDIQRVIQDTAATFKGSIDEARRGVRTHEDTAKAAAETDAWETLAARRTGQPLNAEESLAARQLWVAAADKLRATAEVAARSGSPEDLFQFRRMLTTYQAVQKEVIAARTETARALNAWKIPAGGATERIAAMEQAMYQYGGTWATRSLARAVIDVEAKAGRGALSRLVEKGAFARNYDAVQEFWINALLSGPKTHMVNMISNTSVIGARLSENAVAARVARLLGDENAVQVGEAMAQMHGIRTGFRDALRNAAQTWRTGETGYGINKIELGLRERAISSGSFNLSKESMHGRAVDAIGALVSVPTRALQVEDEFFKTIGYRMSLHEQAYRQAVREARETGMRPDLIKSRMAEIISDPPEAMRLEAASQAAYQTFTNAPGPLIKMLNELRLRFPAFRFILPFVQTPANLLKYAFERTPLAPLTAKYRMAIAKGGADAYLANTRMALGTMVMMASMDWALDGNVTGGGPENAAERANLQRQGWRPYSVRIGERWFSYNRFDPLGLLLGFGANLGEYVANADTAVDGEWKTFERAFAAAVFGAAEQVTSKSYMTGVADLMEAIHQPDTRGPAFLKKFAGSFVPAIARQTQQAVDPVQRETAGIVDEIRGRLPGFSDDLPPRRDIWGRPMSYQSGLGRVYDILSPMYGSEYSPEPVDRAMYEDGYFISSQAKYLMIDGERVSLVTRPDIYSRMVELSGATPAKNLSERMGERYGAATLLETLNRAVSGKGEFGERYRALPDSDSREKFVKDIVEAYRGAARKKLLGEFPELGERAAEISGRKRRLPPLPDAGVLDVGGGGEPGSVASILSALDLPADL